MVIDDIDLEQVLTRIKQRLNILDLDEHASICAYEIDAEFRKHGLELEEDDPRIREVLVALVETGLLHYKVEVGDEKFDLIKSFDDLMTYVGKD